MGFRDLFKKLAGERTHDKSALKSAPTPKANAQVSQVSEPHGSSQGVPQAVHATPRPPALQSMGNECGSTTAVWDSMKCHRRTVRHLMLLCLSVFGCAAVLNAEERSLEARVGQLGSLCTSEPCKTESLYESGDVSLFAGETKEDALHNAANSDGEYHNSLFMRRRKVDGTAEWRLLLTSGGNWKDAGDADKWCKDRACDVRKSFNVLKASLSSDGRNVWLVCNPHIGTYYVVCRYDPAANTFRVLSDGGSAEELSNGMILVRGKKTYLSDETGEPLGAGWYDVLLTPEGKVKGKTRPSREGMDLGKYEMDEGTAKLKMDFESAWMTHVSGHTNHATAGTADDYWDMRRFIKEWKPRILRNQVYKESDPKVRERMVAWMVKENSIDALYHGMLVPHQELMDRRAAYEAIANLPANIDGVDLCFKDGRATWMSREYADREMTAMIKSNFVWPRDDGVVFAFVVTDVSANFESGGGGDALEEYWLLRYSANRCNLVRKLPYKDVQWEPCLAEAPFGRKYTLDFLGGKACVMNCVSGQVVLSVEE